MPSFGTFVPSSIVPPATANTPPTHTDVPLIEGLEATKAAARETTAAVEEGKRTEQAINQARETYRPQVRACLTALR